MLPVVQLLGNVEAHYQAKSRHIAVRHVLHQGYRLVLEQVTVAVLLQTVQSQ